MDIQTKNGEGKNQIEVEAVGCEENKQGGEIVVLRENLPEGGIPPQSRGIIFGKEEERQKRNLQSQK